MMMYKNRMLRRIFWPKIDEVIGEWRALHNEELDLNSSPNIVRVTLSRKMRWVGNVARMEERKVVYRVWKPEGETTWRIEA